jgi:hypothetical protein
MSIALVAILILQAETVRTEHYEVVSTFRNRDYVKSVAEALEAAYPAFGSILGKKPAEKSRYRVHLYATLEEYLEKDRRLNDGRFATYGGFSHPATGEAYVNVAPFDGAAAMLDQRKGLILHEAFHLATFRHASWINATAPWLEEGLAERAVEEAAMVGGNDPLASTIKFANAVNTVRDSKKRAALVPLGSLMEEDPASYENHIKKAAWYYESWLLVKFLKEQRHPKWSAFLRRCESPIEGAELYRPRAVKKALLECLGESVIALEKDWLAWIDGLKSAPWWRVVDFGDWTLHRDGVEGVAVPGNATYLISSDALKGQALRIRAEARVRTEGTGQVDLVLVPPAEDPEACNLVKACLTRKGFASILARRNGAWVNLVDRPFDAGLLKPDAWLRLELEVAGRTVRLRVDGKVAAEHDFSGTVDVLNDVRWGWGNYDSWTRFRGIEIREN